MIESLWPKRCRVYPRNGVQYIPGILTNRQRLELPAELPLNEKELRRCMSFADVYEVREDGSCVYMNTLNYYEDTADEPEATDVPEMELVYPRDEVREGDDDGDEEDPKPETPPEEVDHSCPYDTEEDYSKLPDACIHDDDYIHNPKKEWEARHGGPPEKVPEIDADKEDKGKDNPPDIVIGDDDDEVDGEI